MSLNEILAVYSTKRTSLGKVTLKVRPDCTKLVEEDGVNDRGWKARYFFVEKASLGDAGSWIRDGWKDEGIVSNLFVDFGIKV